MSRAQVTLWAVLLAGSLGACVRDTYLPPPPPPGPVITDFSPKEAFSGQAITVWGTNFDREGNQLTFPGGATAQALSCGPDGGAPPEDGGSVDCLVDGGLVFYVPADDTINAYDYLLLTTSVGSALTPEKFYPLGVGHPNFGTPVSTLKFRHNPVGLIDRVDNVLMASSIFDLVVTDGKAFKRVPGRPIALEPSSRPDRALVAVRTPAGGALVEVDADDGEVLLESDESPVREHFILQPVDVNTVARTIGRDDSGRHYLTEWTETAGRLVARPRRELPFLEIVGAASAGPGMVFLVGRRHTPTLDPLPALYGLRFNGETRYWAPDTDTACDATEARCAAPGGPMTVVSSASGDPTVVVALATGDLLLVKSVAATSTLVRLISYAAIEDIAPGLADDKVIFTKGLDGALFQYDLVTEEADWSVQVRGYPTVIHVEPTIDEVAVGNRTENTVDVVAVSTGTWGGRIAFDLGLGAAGKRNGGVVAPYRYSPVYELERMDVLMRNVGLVASINGSSLDTIDHVVLDPDATSPLQLLVTHDRQTLVVHQRRLGLLEPTGNGDERVERLVTATDVPASLAACVSGEHVVLSSVDRVQSYRWVGSGGQRMLELAGELVLPGGATWLTTQPAGDEVLVLYSTVAGYAGGFYAVADLVERQALALEPGLSDFAGAVTVEAGPALIFGGSPGGGPVVKTVDLLRTPGSTESWSTIISRGVVSIPSPDQQFVVWLDEGAEEPQARLIYASAGGDWVGYSTYRLSGPPSGPAFDPSGQWLFIPIPSTDELSVWK